MKQEKFIEKAKIIHSNFYNYSKVVYINNRTKVCIIDPEYGEFYQHPSVHLKGGGHILRAAEKRKKTNLAKYGVENPQQHIVIYIKINVITKKNINLLKKKGHTSFKYLKMSGYIKKKQY
jgi:hypothetical protein